MKKSIILLIITILVFLYLPVYANGSISISNVELEDISDNAIVNAEPIIDGLSFSMDITFFEPNAYVKYKLEIENTTNEDLIISDDIKFGNNEFINYEYTLDGDSIIKPNSKKILYITAIYKKEVDESLFNNGEYHDSGNMQLNLSNLMVNPKTGYSNITLSIISIIMIAFGIYMVAKYGKKDQLLILVLGLLIIPVSVFAIEQIKLNIKANIIIENNTKTYKLCSYTNQDQCSTYRFKKNMTWIEWLESKYNYNNISFDEGDTMCSEEKIFIINIDEISSLINTVSFNDYIGEKTYYIGIGSSNLCFH